MASAPSAVDAPPWGERQLVVLVDGPRDRRWYFADDWDAEQRADERMGRITVYTDTGERLPHPGYACTGRVWRYDVGAAEREHARLRRAGATLRECGMAAAAAAHPAARELALTILHRAAQAHEVLSADTIRDDLDAADVPGKLRGPLWATAEAHGWVEKVDEQPSGGESAHGKKINWYRSLLIPARRSA